LKTIIATVLIILTASTFSHAQNISKRNTISLNGNWQIAEGTKEVIPKSFDHTVQVPGLVSLATPAATSMIFLRQNVRISGISEKWRSFTFSVSFIL
jgi:hypothetical protein